MGPSAGDPGRGAGLHSCGLQHRIAHNGTAGAHGGGHPDPSVGACTADGSRGGRDRGHHDHVHDGSTGARREPTRCKHRRCVAAASAAAQSAATASSGAGTPPDVVGQDVASAETALHASGYSTAVHPWAATCSAANLVMQQEPPQYGTIQLFYCAAPSGP